MANACVDANDFQTDSGGRLQLNPEYLQTPTLTFTRTLGGAANVYAQIPDIAPLAVVVPGLYLVSWDAHGNATNNPNSPGTPINSCALAGLGLNGALVGGSETMLALNSLGGSPSIAVPALQIHGSGSGSRVIQLAAGDLLSMFGARSSDAGTNTEMISNNQGRCRITAVRIGTS